ncbi:response regulator [Spirosoma spitsbergense]|uniref:response regulator n=1 Tax=Spirosoma spitsbergense TaxID=431554 RepID=UPI001FE02DD1|nr:response regulator [Spirosoma spitsbergense]
MNTLSGSVWLVDDDEDDLMLMQTAFNRMDARLTIKTLLDGEELLPHLQETSEWPKLVVLDLNMCRMGGAESTGSRTIHRQIQPVAGGDADNVQQSGRHTEFGGTRRQ